MKVAVLGNVAYGRAFTGATCTSFAERIAPERVEDYDLVCFTGGIDVDPHMYGHEPIEGAEFDRRRDDAEKEVFEDCVSKHVPMVGICRGAQFLNVMNGGCLIQDCDGHTHTHTIHTWCPKYENIQATSTHHQMMVPTERAVLEAWAIQQSTYYVHTAKNKPSFSLTADGDIKEPEVVFYADTQTLCVQPHPEMQDVSAPGHQYFNALLYRYLFRGEK